MYSVKKSNVISIPRGEYFDIPVELVTPSFPEVYAINLEEGDFVYFGLMEPNHSFDRAILKKEYTYKDVTEDGFINIQIKPEDTLCLKPGRYNYAVKVFYKLSDNDIRITTLIDNTKFIITD